MSDDTTGPVSTTETGTSDVELIDSNNDVYGETELTVGSKDSNDRPYEEGLEILENNVSHKTQRTMLFSGSGEPVMELYLPESGITLSVTVDRTSERIRKPFLGGYRNTKTEIEYHHASCQTNPKARPLTPSEKTQKCHRETQTVEQTSTSQQTNREQGTQMERSDLVQDTSSDRVIIPSGSYFDSEQLRQLQEEKIIKIQAWIRGHFAQQEARKLQQEAEMQWQKQQELRMKRERLQEQRKQTEIFRKTHPKKKEDFEELMGEVEVWRRQETAAIKESNLSPEEKQTALKELLNRETKLLSIIERLRQNATKEVRDDSVSRMLEEMSSSRAFSNSEGGKTLVDTPSIKRARELKALFDQLAAKPKNVDQRLDILLHVKFTVKEFDCRLTRNIIELIDREGDMLNRGRRQSALSGLRQRLNHKFLEFIQTPEFNPEAGNYVRIPLEYANRRDVEPMQ